MLAVGGNMVFKVLCPSVLPLPATAPELLLLLLLLLPASFIFDLLAVLWLLLRVNYLLERKATLCWFKI